VYTSDSVADEEEQICKILKLSLDDERFSSEFKILPKLVCSGRSLFSIRDSNLRINMAALDKKRLTHCVCGAIERIDHWNVTYSKPVIIHGNFETKVDAEIFRIQCFMGDDQANGRQHRMTRSNDVRKDDEDVIRPLNITDNYEWNGVKPDFDQIFAQIIPTRDLLERCSRTKPFVNSTQMNVLIYGIDSMSHVSWRKILPKSYTYLKNTLKSVILDGYNILGDGTAAALIPMLTGKVPVEPMSVYVFTRVCVCVCVITVIMRSICFVLAYAHCFTLY